jgi:hypothetical protein
MDYREVIKKHEDSLYDFYRVRLLVKELVGGCPKDPEMIKGWIGATCKEASQEERAKIVDAKVEALPQVVEEELEATGTTFLVDKECGLYLEGRQLKAMLKEAANIMRSSVPSKKKEGERGVAALKSKMADHVFVEENKVFLNRQKVDKTTQRPIHIEDGPRGPRSAIKVSDIVENVEIEFTVRRLRHGEVTEEALYLCLNYCENLGLGADRSQGYGKFQVQDVQKLTLEEARAQKPFVPGWKVEAA